MPDKITRVYPIRTSKEEWDIPLFSYHACTERCRLIYVENKECNDDYPCYRLMTNTKYNKMTKRCDKYDKIERTFINISDFDAAKPMGAFGALYEPDMIVIPDKSFMLYLTYPLTNHTCATIRAPTSKGFTLTYLIYSIKMLYKFIYEEEARTALTQSHSIKYACKKCADIHTSDYMKHVSIKDIDKDAECAICYSLYSKNNKPIKIGCQHVYHKSCIDTWIESKHDENATCPLCRASIRECDECDGRGYVLTQCDGAVIPIEHRGNVTNRNNTDGLFGIHDFDMEDLVIDYLHYNRLDKTLSLIVTS
jgi:hypothetical protein